MSREMVAWVLTDAPLPQLLQKLLLGLHVFLWR